MGYIPRPATRGGGVGQTPATREEKWWQTSLRSRAPENPGYQRKLLPSGSSVTLAACGGVVEYFHSNGPIKMLAISSMA